MKLLIFSGFLGSGKTTVIQKVIRSLTARGETVAIIENEIGKVGIDQEFLAEAGIKITPLFGGCVCCQISGDLLLATQKIRTEIDPDWIVVELTGLATLTKIIDLFARYGDPDLPILTVAVVDAARWEVLSKIAAPLTEQQLLGAKVVIVNKIDVKRPSPQVLDQITRLAPGAKILPISANKTDGAELFDRIEEALS
jgi:G3E family GTPase